MWITRIESDIKKNGHGIREITLVLINMVRINNKTNC